jgi:hypothetical protein
MPKPHILPLQGDRDLLTNDVRAMIIPELASPAPALKLGQGDPLDKIHD